MQTISSREKTGRVRYTCRCSYLEISSERVKDLLRPEEGKHHTLSHDGQVLRVDGLHEEVVLNGAPPPSCVASANTLEMFAQLMAPHCSRSAVCGAWCCDWSGTFRVLAALRGALQRCKQLAACGSVDVLSQCCSAPQPSHGALWKVYQG